MRSFQGNKIIDRTGGSSQNHHNSLHSWRQKGTLEHYLRRAHDDPLYLLPLFSSASGYKPSYHKLVSIVLVFIQANTYTRLVCSYSSASPPVWTGSSCRSALPVRSYTVVRCPSPCWSSVTSPTLSSTTQTPATWPRVATRSSTSPRSPTTAWTAGQRTMHRATPPLRTRYRHSILTPPRLLYRTS